MPELDSAGIQAYEKDPTGILEKDSEPINIHLSSNKGGTPSPMSPSLVAEMDASQRPNHMPELLSGATVGYPGPSTELPADFNTSQEHYPLQQQAFFSPGELVPYTEQISPPQHEPIVMATLPTTSGQAIHHDSDGLVSTTSGVASSSTPSTPNVAELLERQAKLQEKRKRLLELHQLEQEEEDIRRQLRESQGQ